LTFNFFFFRLWSGFLFSGYCLICISWVIDSYVARDYLNQPDNWDPPYCGFGTFGALVGTATACVAVLTSFLQCDPITRRLACTLYIGGGIIFTVLGGIVVGRAKGYGIPPTGGYSPCDYTLPPELTYFPQFLSAVGIYLLCVTLYPIALVLLRYFLEFLYFVCVISYKTLHYLFCRFRPDYT